jgi:hypothetical protein
VAALAFAFGSSATTHNYVGDTFEQNPDSYRVLAIQTGHGPFDYVIEAEWLASSRPSEFEPA